MTPLLLFTTAFIVRAVVGMLFEGPAYPDSYYYVNVARELAAGNGFQVGYIWSFVDVGGQLPADPTLPIPSNGHWMPLASLVMVPFIWLLGASPVAFGLPFWIAGAAAAPLTWAIGRQGGLGSTVSVGAGLLVAVPGGMTPFLSQPDNFGLFMPLGALALWLCARGMQGDRRAFVIGGLVVGLATLARNDGVLLGLPFALVAARELLSGRRGEARIGLAAAVGCAALFALLMAPWLARQLAEFGTISPSADSGRILWITDYSQLHSISTGPPTPASLLSQGLGPLLASRLGGLVAAIGLFTLLPLVAVLTPPALIGAWRERSNPSFAPFFVYAAALFAVSALFFAVHVPYGTFIHSASALLPHTYLLVMVGIASAVGWAQRRRPQWDTRQATVFFSAGAVLIAVLGAGFQTARTTTRWSEVRAAQEQLAPSLRAMATDERVMSADPGALNFIAARRGIVTPNDPLTVVEQAIRAYGVRWLVLERAQIVPSLQPVLLGESAPSWLSRPVATTVGDSGQISAALFAVCLEPGDTRCSP